jgi:hypothetical protein
MALTHRTVAVTIIEELLTMAPGRRSCPAYGLA